MKRHRIWSGKNLQAVALATIFLISLPFSTEAAAPVLPNARVTPGLINPFVTQENIHSTICVRGYTKTIRPLSAYTTRLKINQLNSKPYSSYGSTLTSLFEEDHLIPLEIGGNPTSSLNLWPEPWTSARVKDKLENKLHKLVCDGSLSLSEAQSAVSVNWYMAYRKYILNENLSITGPSQSSSSAEPPASPAGGGDIKVPAGSTGKCNDGTFSQSASHRGMCSGHGGVARYYP